MEYGGISGKAVDFDFNQPTQMQQPQRQQRAGGDGFDIEMPDDFMLMDGPGMEQELYENYFALRDIYKQYRKMGINLSQAPDPSDPRSAQARANFRQYQTMFMSRAKELTQARERQKDLEKLLAQGNAYVSPEIFADTSSPISSKRYGQSVWNPNKFLQDVNSALSESPLTPDDTDRLAGAYEDALDIARKQGENANLSEDQIREIQSRIQLPTGLDPLIAEKMKTQKSIQAKNYAQAKAAKKTGQQDEEGFVLSASTQNILGMIQDTIQQSSMNPTSLSPASPNNPTRSFSGTNLGKGINRVEINPDGSGKLYLEDEVLEEGKTVTQTVNGKKVNKTLPPKTKKKAPIQWTADDMMPVFRLLYTPTQLNKITGQLNAYGLLKNGKLAYKDAVNFMNNGVTEEEDLSAILKGGATTQTPSQPGNNNSTTVLGGIYGQR